MTLLGLPTRPKLWEAKAQKTFRVAIRIGGSNKGSRVVFDGQTVQSLVQDLIIPENLDLVVINGNFKGAQNHSLCQAPLTEGMQLFFTKRLPVGITHRDGRPRCISQVPAFGLKLKELPGAAQQTSGIPLYRDLVKVDDEVIRAPNKLFRSTVVIDGPTYVCKDP